MARLIQIWAKVPNCEQNYKAKRFLCKNSYFICDHKTQKALQDRMKMHVQKFLGKSVRHSWNHNPNSSIEKAGRDQKRIWQIYQGQMVIQQTNIKNNARQDNQQAHGVDTTEYVSIAKALDWMKTH